MTSTQSRRPEPSSTTPPAYLTLRRWRDEEGGPCRAQAYRLAAMGKLKLTRTIDGRVLVSAPERARYRGED